jgi:hypothetical protein
MKWAAQLFGKLILLEPLEEITALVGENFWGNNMNALYSCHALSLGFRYF